MKQAGWSLKLFQREQRSLFGEILDWMLAPLLLLWPMSVALTWLVAQNIASRPFDRDLAEMVRTMARQVVVVPGSVEQPSAIRLRVPEVAWVGGAARQ